MKKLSLLLIVLIAITSAKADLVVDSLGTVHMSTAKANQITLSSSGKITYTNGGKILNSHSGEAINIDPSRGIYYTDFASDALFASQRPQYGFSVGANNAFSAYFYNSKYRANTIPNNYYTETKCL